MREFTSPRYQNLQLNCLCSRLVGCGGVGLPSACDKRRQAHLYAEAQLSIAAQLMKMQQTNSTKVQANTNPAQINSGTSLFQEAINNGSPSTRLRLQQALDSHSCAFLTAKPCGSTELSDEAFSAAIRLRFGLDLLPAGFDARRIMSS